MKIKKTCLQIAQDQPLQTMTEIIPNKVKIVSANEERPLYNTLFFFVHQKYVLLWNVIVHCLGKS